MSTQNRPLITVGIADAAEAYTALAWACRHAAAVGARLHLVHAFIWADHDVNTEPIPGVQGSGLRAAAERLLADAAERAQEKASGIEVTTELIDGQRTAVMLASSHAADAVVVGARGLGRFLAAIAGSTSRTLARQAASPVVVVRHDAGEEGAVGLAYDEGHTTEETVRRAVDLARAYGTPLTVVHAAGISGSERERAEASAREAIQAVDPELAAETLTISGETSLTAVAEATAGLRVLVISAPDTGQRTDRALRIANTAVWIERG